MKECIACLQEKALSEFYANGKYYTPRCKVCHRAYMKDQRSGENWQTYYEQNKDNILKACSRYYARKKKQPMKLKHLAILVALLMIVLACKKEPQAITLKPGNIKVELLFEHEGCKMYRFNDGRTVYWSDCRGKIQADYTTHNGKSSNTHYEETITTQ